MQWICANEWEKSGGDDGCESDGGNEEGNDEGGNYNGCTFNLGIGGDGMYSNSATGDGCNWPLRWRVYRNKQIRNRPPNHCFHFAPPIFSCSHAGLDCSQSSAYGSNGQCNSELVNHGQKSVRHSDDNVLEYNHPATCFTNNFCSDFVDISKRKI